jgi:hypothetical protein
MDHLDPLVLLFGNEGDGVAFGAVEAHGFHVGLMAESNHPHPLHRILDVAPPDSRQGEAGRGQDSDQQEPEKKTFHRSTSMKSIMKSPKSNPSNGQEGSSPRKEDLFHGQKGICRRLPGASGKIDWGFSPESRRPVSVVI